MERISANSVLIGIAFCISFISMSSPMIKIMPMADLVSVSSGSTKPAIRVWYGHKQRFGHLGQAQRWVNVLGNVTEPEKIDTVTFSLNSGPDHPLTLGSDLHRLAMPGDFKVELPWKDLRVGENILSIKARPKSGKIMIEQVQLLVEKDRTWPLPYFIDFSGLPGFRMWCRSLMVIGNLKKPACEPFNLITTGC